MIECDINWNSGWGNEVIQYCFGRCLGAELDYYVKCPKIRYLKNSGDWNLDGKRFDDPVYEITEHNHKHRTNLDFLKSQTDCKFVVKSFLEYYPFFEKYADEIKNDWMYLDQPYSPIPKLTISVIWAKPYIKKYIVFMYVGRSNFNKSIIPYLKRRRWGCSVSIFIYHMPSIRIS